MPAVWCRSDFWCLTSDVQCLMSDLWCLMSDIWCQMSFVWCPMGDFLCMMSDIRCLMSDVWCSMYDVAQGLSKALLGVYSLLFPANNVAGPCVFYPMPSFGRKGRSVRVYSQQCFTVNYKPGIAISIERFHSRGQHLCKFVGTKESFYVRKEFNSHGKDLEQQHGRCFIVFEHQYGRRDVMWKHSIRSRLIGISQSFYKHRPISNTRNSQFGNWPTCLC